jgi:hypothetical protein
MSGSAESTDPTHPYRTGRMSESTEMTELTDLHQTRGMGVFYLLPESSQGGGRLARVISNSPVLRSAL